MAGRRSLGVETISISHDDPLRDLFEACKHGDVSRVSLILNSYIQSMYWTHFAKSYSVPCLVI